MGLRKPSGEEEHPTPDSPLTYQQFLDFVAGKEGRYEYVGGRAVAMGNPATNIRILR